jgi:hypothetical protein
MSNEYSFWDNLGPQTPPPVVFLERGFDRPPVRYRSRRKRKYIALGIAACLVGGVTYANRQNIKEAYSTWQESKRTSKDQKFHCMPSAIAYQGKDYEVCFNAQSMFRDVTGKMAVLVTFRSLQLENSATTTVSEPVPPTTIVRNDEISYWQAMQALSIQEKTRCEKELLDLRTLIISKGAEIASDSVGSIPNSVQDIVIYSDYPGDQKNMLEVTCEAG